MLTYSILYLSIHKHANIIDDMCSVSHEPKGCSYPVTNMAIADMNAQIVLLSSAYTCMQACITSMQALLPWCTSLLRPNWMAS